ncbi:MAG: ankyrin repeat domain-containing protein, partial [Chloroflexota bacterium]
AYGANDFANQPLHAAAAGRHVEVCRVLLTAGADVNATQHGGYAPLHEAAGSGDVELAELFLSAGADADARLPDGSTAAAVAEAAGHHDLAVRLGSR